MFASWHILFSNTLAVCDIDLVGCMEGDFSYCIENESKNLNIVSLVNFYS